MTIQDKLTQAILDAYPQAEAIYLFGSWGTEDEWPSSDIDIAILLPPDQAKAVDYKKWLLLSDKLGDIAHKTVDLLNLRLVSTVLQKEVIMADRCIYTDDTYAADEFEILTLSLYQKLNQERADVLAAGLQSGRFYQ